MFKPPEISGNVPVFDVGKHLKTGNEHRVYESSDGQNVFKTRGILGPIWQSMDVDAARHDFDILQEHGFPVVPTEFYDDALLRKNGRYQHTDYLVRQPKIPHNLIDFYRLEEDSRVREMVRTMMEMRHEIYKRTGLGVDLMGGDAYVDLMKTIRRHSAREVPIFWEGETPLNPPINNLLLATEDVVRDGETVAKKDEILLMDVRLFRPAEQSVGILRRAIASTIITPTHHVITGAVATALERLDSPPGNGVRDDQPWGYKLGAWAAHKMIDDLRRRKDIDS
ncbi:hypothetical protein KJ742_05775 [Patescibacteria group bacterium]|nr:hypothetical protein [Patescibacteria group bacterium]MBU1683426.1 hypothetical protein [Patescibacteria group bacterium]MBU1935697.1 hypothetical protein [Patescibacteria group bacterium]